MGKKPVDKNREWEKERRNKLNVGFNNLLKLLPEQDPTKAVSKMEILKRAAEYIKLLQEQNDEIINSKGNDSVFRQEADRLKKRVAFLLLKTKELVEALRNAGVPLPNDKKRKKKRKISVAKEGSSQNDQPKPVTEAIKFVNSSTVEELPEAEEKKKAKCGCDKRKSLNKPLAEVNSSTGPSMPHSSVHATTTGVLTTLVPALTVNKTILSSTLGPGTLIFRDGRVVNVPPPTAAMPIVMKPTVTTVAAAPQPPTLVLVKKDKLPPIFPKWRDITQTTYANKAPIPAVKTFRLESCPRTKKPRPKKVKTSTEDKIKKPEVTVSTETSSASTCTSVASGESTIVPGESIESGKRKNAEIDCEHARKVPRTESSADDTDSPQKHSVDSLFNVQEPPRVEKENASPQEIGGKEVHQSSANQEIHGSEIPEDAFTEVMNQSAVAQGINQSAAAGQVCVDEIHRSSSSEEPAQVTPVAPREMSRNAVPQEIGRSVVSQDVLQQSVVSREVQPSSIPHGVQQSFVPHEVQRSASSHEVQRSAIPQEIHQRGVPREVQRSAVPHEVQRSAVSHEVQRSAVPRELQRSVVHQEIHQSAASHEVHRSVVRQAINQSAVPHEVQRSAVPPEVQRSAVPHEVQRSAVPHEVQRSAVPHEVQRSAVHQEIHQTAVPHEVQRSAVPHEVQRSAVHQESHQTAVSHEVQRSAVPHEVQRSAVPHEVQRSAVPHEVQRSVVHQEIHQTAVPLEVQRSVVPHELQRRVVHQETHQTAVPHEGQRSKAPHEVQRSAVPHEVQRSVVHQEIHQTAVLPEMHRSVVHQAINQSAVSHEVQRSVVPHEIQRSVVPHEVQRIAIPHEDQRSVVSREVTRSAAPHGVQRSLTHQSLIPREVQRSVVLHEVQRTSRKTQPSGASLEINSSVAREETLRSTISQEMPHGVNLREPRPHESQTDSDKSVEKEVEPASNPTAPTLKDNSRRDPATSLSYSHIETSFPSFSSPMTSKPVNRELFPMTSTSCSDLQLSSTESFNYQPTNQIFSYNSTYSKNQIYPETTMTKTTPHDNQLYFVPPPPPTLPTSSQSCNFSVNNIANSAAPTFSTSSDYRSHFSHTQAQQNYCSFSNGNMFAPAQTQTYNTVNTDQNYNFNITSRASNDIFPQTFQKPFNVATIASRSLQPNQNPHLYHNSNFLINQQKSFPTTTSSYGNQTNQVSQPKKNVTAASFSVSSIANENLSYSGANNSNIQVSKKNFGMSDITSTTSQPSSYSQNQQTFQNSRSFFTVGHMTDTSAPPLFPTRTYQNGQSCHFSASTPADSLLTDFNQVIGKTSSRTVSSENKTTQCGSDKMEKLYSTNTEGNSFKTSNNLCDRTFPPLDDVRLPSEYSNDLFSSLQVPSGGAHSESISPTAAFLLAFPLVTSKTTDNLTEAEPQDNHASTPTTILQIGNIEPPNSELFQPMEFGKELVSDFLSQDKYGAKRKEKKKPDYNASGYAYPQYLAETLYDPSWNDPQKTKTQQERKKPDKQYDYYNKDKKKKNNKITVNWMAAPEADLISSYPKEIEYPSSSQFSSMEIDNFPDLCLTKKNGTYSWSPSKSLLPLDSSALMIPATLPTLVGDLALGTTTPSADSSYRNRCEKKSDKPEDKRIPPKGGNNFLSVSQLVDPKAKKAKPTQQSKKQDKKAKNCPYQKRKDVEPCMYSDNFLPNITWDKQRYKGNYSAESLIGTQQQHHQQQQEMTDTLNFNYQQNSYYYQTSDLGNVESMAPSTGQYSQNSFNFPQSSHLGTLMPEEFPSENFSLNGGSSRTTSQLVDKTRPLNESTPSSYHHHTSSHPQSPSSSSSFTSYHTSSYPPPPPPPRPTGMPSSTTHPPPPPPPPPPVPPIPPPSANVPPPPPPPPPPVPPPSQPNFSHSSTTPSLPNFHVTSNTTTSLTNFNLSTIFPEMNERTTVQGVGAGQQTQLVKHLNPFMNSVPNYRNHAL